MHKKIKKHEKKLPFLYACKGCEYRPFWIFSPSTWPTSLVTWASNRKGLYSHLWFCLAALYAGRCRRKGQRDALQVIWEWQIEQQRAHGLPKLGQLYNPWSALPHGIFLSHTAQSQIYDNNRRWNPNNSINTHMYIFLHWGRICIGSHLPSCKLNK